MEARSEEAPKTGESNGGSSRPKRQMKTPFQLETLEKAYATETYPSEAMRVELSEKLGLSDRQLQMWFCHRRLKDKNSNPAKKMRKLAAVVAPEYSKDPVFAAPEPGSDYGSGSGSGSSNYGSRELQMVGYRRDGDDIGVARRYCESPRTIMELRAIACVEAQLGEPLREDGPILGMEFDPLPPDAFGAPIATIAEHKQPDNSYDNKLYGIRDAVSSKAVGRSGHEYQFLHDQRSTLYDAHGQVVQKHFHEVPIDGNEKLLSAHGVHGQLLRVCRVSQEDKERPGIPMRPGDAGSLQQRDSLTSMRLKSEQVEYPVRGIENSLAMSDGKVFYDDPGLQVERKHKNEEVRIAREIEVHDNRIRKALEKENVLRRKTEDRLRKEMERYDRERRKEEERLMREKQREEERLQREQRKEVERREKFLQKEYIRAEKRRQKEQQRREKEAERRKVAMERATARRIAKESMELMDDEQLELMELAATKKGLPSIVHLDHDTLQNLDLFRDSLSAFPSQTSQLKRPFSVQPWVSSEENAGNLLMAWRFLITFADVLGLWPFTLDEFIQAFHDYDSRLLGEIHLALLKSIVKDIEDVARTPATGLGTNQSGAAILEGGHPQIVEGAYAWGFDIEKWKKHLNPLTWPEIFRQLALSAGFGPQLKRSVLQPHLQEGDEVKNSKDIIYTLRSSSAAEKAFAIMRERGLLLPKRSRHRLTPGTVKFAAFHVLSLEGIKGLTVLDLADKIQKSGLRDLSTSKTPEASISVALTRDTKLFERIAPSTYRVRASYRKDPADAETILSEARKKIRIFENGFLDEVERDDDVERDEDAERDEESEGDVEEDPDVDDLATPSGVIKEVDQYSPVNELPVIKEEEAVLNRMDLENENGRDFISSPASDLKDPYCLSTMAEQGEAGVGICDGKVDQESVEIDESKSGESWAHGLTEGEYSHLSVEERLNALVALIGIANEGNSIRAILEDRMEAANALKKQMLAEVQLDKSRLKDEFISKVDLSSFTGGKTETQVPAFSMESNHGQWPAADTKRIDSSPSLAENHKPLISPQTGFQNDFSSLPTERTTVVVQDSSGVPDNFLQNGYVSRRSRSQLKSYIAQRAEEIYVYRSLPLGQDRRRNRYWQFVASSSSNDPGSGRIFVELNDGCWRLIDSEEAFDALLMSLDARGIRESHLRVMLLRIEKSFKDSIRKTSQSAPQSRSSIKNEIVEMDNSPHDRAFGSPSSVVSAANNGTSEVSSSFRIEIGRNHFEKGAALRRYRDFLKWVSGECFNSASIFAMRVGRRRSDPLLIICDSCLCTYFGEEKHCFSCHMTFADNLDFSRHVMKCEVESKSDLKDSHLLTSSVLLGIRLLKALLAYIEVSIPPEALQSFWTEDRRRSWGMKLKAASSPEEFLQMLSLLEDVIRREYLSSEFERTKDLLRLPESSVQDFDLEHASVLPWIPQTIAASALRLLELDSSIIYVKLERSESHKDHLIREDMKPDLKPAVLKIKEVELPEGNQNIYLKEKPGEVSNGRKSNKQVSAGRDRSSGRKWQRRSSASRSKVSSQRNSRNSQNLLGQQQGRRIQAAQGSSSYVRGPRTVRKRRAENKVAEQTSLGHMGAYPVGVGSRRLNQGWTHEPRHPVHVDEASMNSDSAEYDENENGNETVVGYDIDGDWREGFAGSSNGWNKNSMEEEEEDDCVSEEEEEYNELEEENLGEEFEGNVVIGADVGSGGSEDEDEEVSETAVSEDYSE